jgi:hypothetical protein
MKSLRYYLVLFCCGALMACGGGAGSGSSESGEESSSNLTNSEKAQLVAAALTTNQGGVGEDIATVTNAATGGVSRQAQLRDDALNLSITVEVDFYDAQGNPQDRYDAQTTDQIDYRSVIEGDIIRSNGYFDELIIDNRADFSVDDILSRLALINGRHTNHSEYRRTQNITSASIRFTLDSELTMTGVTVDLDAADRFPESGIIEGELEGTYERSGPVWQETRQFRFYFIATYLGDNTAEVELTDGTTYIVHLNDGEVVPIND